MDPKSFRNLFLGSLDKKLSQKEAALLLYLPTPSITDTPKPWKNPKDFFSKWAKKNNKTDPIKLYKKSLATPALPVSQEEIHKTLKEFGFRTEDRLTFVIFPGILSEFIDTRTFEEVFQKKNSAFQKFWKSKLRDAKKSNRKAIIDSVFSLEKLAQEKRNLSDLISVSSIDDKNGEALVNAITFNTEKMSLETMGDIKNCADVFQRRLLKFFEIAGTPQNLIFLGYSRGTPIALEILARAKSEKSEWLSNVKAVISFGGVTYGTELADDAFNSKNLSPPPLLAQQLTLLENFGNELLEPKTGSKWSLENIHIIFIKNRKTWWNFIKNLAATSFKNSKFSLKDIKHFEGIDLNSATNLVLTILERSFRFDQSWSQYKENIRRGKILTQAIVTGFRQLTTHERLKWWKTHLVPTDGIKYYSIGGTLVNTMKGDQLNAKVATNALTYNPRLPDDLLQRKNYEDFLKASGIALNDGQVALHKIQFWPELAIKLNPKQTPMDSTFLGILGTHHWGMALKVVCEKPGLPLSTNPFPREALLKALAAAVALDQLTMTH